MAGLYDQIKSGSDEKVSVHLLQACLCMVAEGEITKQQAIDILNEQIGADLSGQSLTDMNAILNVLEGKATQTLMMRYFLKVDSANMTVEQGSTAATEAKWRQICEIP